MRVVLDTNVLVSAALKLNLCREWRLWWSSAAAVCSNRSQENVVPSLRGAERRSNLDRLSTTRPRLLRFARNDSVS
jgi:hypothetical protein